MKRKTSDNRAAVCVGDYELSNFMNFEGKEVVWIEHNSGEGMEVSMESIGKLIDKFYKENF